MTLENYYKDLSKQLMEYEPIKKFFHETNQDMQAIRLSEGERRIINRSLIDNIIEKGFKGVDLSGLQVGKQITLGLRW